MVDTIKQSDFRYRKGLEDAWECARKLCVSEKYGGLEERYALIFGRQDIFDVFDYSVQEAMQKIKEYEERQNVKKVYEEKFMPIGKANMEKRREERQTEIKCDTCKYEGSSFSPCIKCKDNSEFEPKEERQTEKITYPQVDEGTTSIVVDYKCDTCKYFRNPCIGSTTQYGCDKYNKIPTASEEEKEWAKNCLEKEKTKKSNKTIIKELKELQITNLCDKCAKTNCSVKMQLEEQNIKLKGCDFYEDKENHETTI
jgi:hypothetical protein